MVSETLFSKSDGLGLFEKYLYVWLTLCILAAIALGELAPPHAARGERYRALKFDKTLTPEYDLRLW